MERNEYMDFLKGVCILTVIVGHSITNVDKLSDLFNLIYSFHMPVLIFISAYLEEQNRKKYDVCFYKMIEKRMLGLLVPYLSWNVIYSYKLFDGILHFEYKVLWDRIVGREQSGLWFLACLFGLKCVHAIYWHLQSKWKRDNVWINIFLMVMLELAIILLAIATRNSYIVNMISYAIPYFAGVLLANTPFRERLVKNDGFVMLFMIFYLVVFQMFNFKNTSMVTQIIRIFLALCVIVLCCKYQTEWSNNKKWKKNMCMFGRYSLGIYLIHGYFLNYEMVLAGIDSAYIAGMLATLLGVGVAYICVIIVKILSLSRYVARALFGK